MSAACVEEEIVPEPVVPVASEKQPINFQFITLESTSFNQEKVRGRVSIIAFLTTYDLQSQLMAQRLEAILHRATPRINIVGVVMEPESHAPLVQVFKEDLHLSYPIVLASGEIVENTSPFGEILGMPSYYVLMADGRIDRGEIGSPTEEEILSWISSAR